MGTQSGEPAVRASGLVKTYGPVRALDGVDLAIPAGQVLALLGPNGAGKTTTVRILTTLLRPDGGRAWVAGHDVLTDPGAVRKRIGVSGQSATVDEHLTGYENLYLVGRFYGLSRSAARARSRELLADFGLEESAGRPARTYSGGMCRRLDLAGALVARPSVIVLDEPTTGLDPRGRLDTWEMIGKLVRDGAAVLLTTQYLEEADRLADAIAVIDRGQVIARGTAHELKSRIGTDRLEVVVSEPAEPAVVRRVLAGIGADEPTVDDQAMRVGVPVYAGPKALSEALRRLDDEPVTVLDVGLRRPTLDDVFLSLTGQVTAKTAAPSQKSSRRNGKRFGRRRKTDAARAGAHR